MSLGIRSPLRDVVGLKKKGGDLITTSGVLAGKHLMLDFFARGIFEKKGGGSYQVGGLIPRDLE